MPNVYPRAEEWKEEKPRREYKLNCWTNSGFPHHCISEIKEDGGDVSSFIPFGKPGIKPFFPPHHDDDKERDVKCSLELTHALRKTIESAVSPSPHDKQKKKLW